jgi:2-hydroxy-3-keto-5-methylthiopentenyl-1-phosphate phosphatase
VLPIGSILVDFDGTACLHDAAEHLLVEFGDPSWPELDAAWERGELDSRRVISAQAAMLGAPLDEMVAFALEHCPIDPTFPAFVRWLEDREIAVEIASDGFGFYIPPLLSGVGLDHVPITTNTWTDDGIEFGNAHPECLGCGTCKMNAVFAARRRGAVAFVGEGPSDRYGSLYSDVVFAKDALVEIARRDGVPLLRWNDFDDVRRGLEALEHLPGPTGGDRCPGWRVA